MEHPARRRFPGLALLWLVIGLAMLGVSARLALTRVRPVLAGHPVMVATAFGSIVVGLFAVVLAVAALVERRRPWSAERTPDRATRRGSSRARRRAMRIASIPALVVCIAAVLLLGYSRPMEAEEVALLALRTTPSIAVRQHLTSYELVPTRTDARGRDVAVTTGLVFYPGAKVDARAYASLLRPLAASGYLVVVLKEPFGLALLDPHQAESVPELHPEITHWVVGGHSLGGVAASGVADQDRDFSGLLLYASEPGTALDRVNLSVLSISGSEDGLETPAEIDASKDDLPSGSTFTTIEGGVHNYFGDYGTQDGDGQPTTSRNAAQAQIVAATRAFMAEIAATRPSTGRGSSASSSPSSSPSAAASPSASPTG